MVQQPHKRQLFRGYYLSLVLLAAALVTTALTPLRAAEYSAGLGAVEEGDDRGRGTAILQAAFANNWSSKLYVWGRSYGPVTETSGIVSVGKRYDIFGSKNIHSMIAFSSLAESTSIEYKDAPSESSSYTSTNFGLMLGISYDLYKSKSLNVTASWDSHLYSAGEAVLLLVTGRKQILGLTAGITL